MLDPYHLTREIESIRAQGVEVTPDNLKVAENVPLILSLHRELDAHRESATTAGVKIGKVQEVTPSGDGAKVVMDGAPWVDRLAGYDPKRLRLADIDGTGTTDVLYLEPGCVRIWRNQSGNGFADPVEIALPSP